MSSGDDTVWPAIDSITSPWARPAWAAGEPWRTPLMAAPELLWLPPEKPPPSMLLWELNPTRRKRVVPMCTVSEALPASIWSAMVRALLIGIAKPWVWVCDDPDEGCWPEGVCDPPNGDCPSGDWLPPHGFCPLPNWSHGHCSSGDWLPDEAWAVLEAAVLMPMTWPWVLASAPPESPGWMFALVSIIPARCSELPPPSSLAVMAWFSPVTFPAATDDRRRVGAAVAHVGDLDGRGAVDHMIVGQDLTGRGQHQAGARGLGVL